MSQGRRTKVKLEADDTHDAPHHLPSANSVREALGVKMDGRSTTRVMELAMILWYPKDASEAQINAQVARALELYEGLAPTDAAEGMLAAQMVGTHHAALQCLRVAAQPKHTHDSLNMAMKYAQKLMALYVQQLAALDKHRGKGQQKVTVEHVHVEAGGRAIVGHVETGPRPSATDAPPALSEGAVIPLEPLAARRKARKS